MNLEIQEQPKQFIHSFRLYRESIYVNFVYKLIIVMNVMYSVCIILMRLVSILMLQSRWKTHAHKIYSCGNQYLQTNVEN